MSYTNNWHNWRAQSKRIFFTLPFVFVIGAAKAVPLRIMLEPYPPFAYSQAGVLRGPFPEVFQALANEQGLQIALELIPSRRALMTLEKQPDTCLLATHYIPAMAEVVLYIGKVAPLYIWAYSRQGEFSHVKQLSQLRGLVVAGIEIPELRDATDSLGMRYQRLPASRLGYQMLMAKRFDILLSDISPDLLAQEAHVGITRLFMVTQGERWLACQRNISKDTIDKLRKAMKDGLFAESSKAIWEKYRLADYYLHVRKEWLTPAK